jgi:hypothetical protein
MVLLGCAPSRPAARPAQRIQELPQPIQELTFTKLQGVELAVRVVNRDLTFAGSVNAMRAARAAVSQQLSDKGVRVIEDAPRTWVLEVSDARAPGGADQRCVRVDAHLALTAQPFLPALTSSAVSCSGEGHQAHPGADPISLVWELGRLAVNSADGTYEKHQATALFSAVEEALLQLDARTKY